MAWHDKCPDCGRGREPGEDCACERIIEPRKTMRSYMPTSPAPVSVDIAAPHEAQAILLPLIRKLEVKNAINALKG